MSKLKSLKSGYEFAELGGSPEDGYNDPLRTMFDRDCNDVVARESLQNVLDAVRDKTKPAVVEFRLQYFSRKQIPSAETLKKTFEACAAYGVQSRAHFKNTIELLGTDRIPVLKISDYNTVGLSGEDDDQTGNFYNFLKSVGATGKSGAAGGSYGLGKGSFIAASAFDTFFVTSVFQKSGKFNHVFMGSLRLTTHRIGQVKMRGVGSYGNPGQKPIRNIDAIPKQFLREPIDTGTDIFILAYRDQEDWKNLITKSVLKNFWLAIEKKYLEVRVGGIEISSRSLEKLMYEHYKPRDREEDWKKRNPLPYYEAFKKGKETAAELDTLGKVSVHINTDIAGESAPNYVACFRKTGMLIYHKNFHSVVRYAGVFICDADK